MDWWAFWSRNNTVGSEKGSGLAKVVIGKVRRSKSGECMLTCKCGRMSKMVGRTGTRAKAGGL